MIQVTGLTKRYGNKRGVEDITFHVDQGEIVGLLGPNGAGKSTIMKMLTGYHMMTSGRIVINGCDMLEDPDQALRHVGFMPELPPLYLEMEVEEYLLFAAAIKGVPKGERKAHVERLLGLTGVGDVRGRPIGNLSKGYRQRVGLAQALVGDPKILILDEPTAGLDPRQITEVRDLLKHLSRDHTIIVSSHILAEIGQTCDRVVIISNGRLVAEDTMENLSRGQEEGNLFRLKAACNREELSAALGDIPSIEKIEGCGTDCGAGGDRRWFEITAPDTDEVRQAVSAALARHQIPLLELNSGRLSLEQVFLRLTDARTGEGAAP